jgi:hypothetical protein
MRELDIHGPLNPSLETSSGKLGEPGVKEIIYIRTKKGFEVPTLGRRRPGREVPVSPTPPPAENKPSK